jgi:glucose-6-phosphate 1-dehydrogenase
VGATGDLSRRRLLPGLFHLSSTGFIPGCQIIGVSLDQIDSDGFRKIARGALDHFSSRKVEEADWAMFSETLQYVPIAAGAHVLKVAVEQAEQKLGCETRRVHYLSVPPSAALAAVSLLAEANLVDRSRIIMEKPFGTKIAFREPPKSMFPMGSGVGAQFPDHLTFDLADASKMSLSFYGKRPGPGMRLDKQSLQFAMHDTGMVGDVLEAYERLILDAMRGDHTLFTTAEGIERLWEVSIPLLEAPPPVRLYPPGAWGPKSIHQLVAPHAWRLPFERAWRDPNPAGG